MTVCAQPPSAAREQTYTRFGEWLTALVITRRRIDAEGPGSPCPGVKRKQPCVSTDGLIYRRTGSLFTNLLTYSTYSFTNFRGPVSRNGANEGSEGHAAALTHLLCHI